LEENYLNLERIVSQYHSVFTALDFGPLCPIPGSLSFRYLIDPDFAKMRAEEYGLLVNVPYLNSIKHKYINQDLLNMDELVSDFIYGCCPETSLDQVNDYLERIRLLARKYSIVIGGGV
jgi:hypothetical protein